MLSKYIAIVVVILMTSRSLCKGERVANENDIECARALLCKVLLIDVTLDYGTEQEKSNFNKMYRVVSLLSSDMVINQVENCTEYLTDCEPKVMALMKKPKLSTLMNDKVLACGWETFPYMIFHCAKIASWYLDVQYILKRNRLLPCENLPICPCVSCFDEFANVTNYKLPKSWESRRKESRDEYDANRAFQNMKNVWPNHEQLIRIAQEGKDVVKSPNLDSYYKRQKWLMCEPGTYLTKYTFGMHSSVCRRQRSWHTRYMWSTGYDSIHIECTGIDGRHLNKHKMVESPTVDTFTHVVNSTNFFVGFVMVDYYSDDLDTCQIRLSHFLMSKGYIQTGNNLTVVGLPIEIPVMNGDNPELTEGGSPLTNVKFQTNLRKREYVFHEHICPDGLIVCGLQPATYNGFSITDIFSISIFCCRPQYYCVRSTQFAEVYRDEPLDLTEDDEGPLKTFTITSGTQISKSRTEGGNRSTTMTHTATITAGLSLGGAEGALGGSVSASYSYSHSSTDSENWSKTVGEVNHVARSSAVSYRLVYGALNTFHQVQVQCGLIDVLLKEIMHVVIVQGGTDYCNAEVKWIFQTYYDQDESEHVLVPYGANFSHPGQRHLDVPEGGSPYLAVTEVTNSFLRRFTTDNEINERLEVSRHNTLEKVMSNYAGRQRKTSLLLRRKNGNYFPLKGFAFQQVGVCNHRALPDKYQFIVYTDNFRAIGMPDIQCGLVWDKYEMYDSFYNFHGQEKIHIRTTIKRGISILNREKDLIISETGMDKVPELVKQLQKTFSSIDKSKTTGVDWSRIAQGYWGMEKNITRPWNVTAPPQTRIEFYHLVGQCGNWVYTHDTDAYQIISRKRCAVATVGFVSGAPLPVPKCPKVEEKGFSCTPEEKFKKTSPVEMANLDSEQLTFRASYAVGILDTQNTSKKVSDQHNQVIFAAFKKLGVGPLTVFPWNNFTTTSWENGILQPRSKEISIPPGLVAETFQVVGICGQYQVQLNVVYTKYLSYNEDFQGGDAHLNGTGPFSKVGFTFPISAILKD